VLFKIGLAEAYRKLGEPAVLRSPFSFAAEQLCLVTESI